MEKGQFKSFEEAAASVQGTKVALVTAKKMFTVPGFGMDDMFAVADMAIFEAFKSWEPEKAKFNTHAYNYINFKLSDALNEMNGIWKINEQVTYEQSYYHNETYKSAKAAGKTLDDDFNTENGLDGSDESKQKFNRTYWNNYIQMLSNQRGLAVLINESSFATEDSENFSIMDTQTSYDFDEYDEMKTDAHALPADKKKIAEMLLGGAEIGEVAKEMKMTKVKLLQMYAPKDKLYA